VETPKVKQYSSSSSELGQVAYRGLAHNAGQNESLLKVASQTQVVINRFSPEEINCMYKPNGAMASIQHWDNTKETKEESKKALPKKAARESQSIMAIPTSMGAIGMKVKLSKDNGSGFWIVTGVDNGVVVLSKGKETRQVVSSRKGTGNNVFWVVPNEAIVKKYNRMVRKGNLC